MKEVIKVKKFLRALLVLCVICVFLPLGVSAQTTVIDSGTWNGNLTWELSQDGTLTISGTGPMSTISYEDDHEILVFPWRKYSEIITTVIVEDGVTSIANNAFYYYFWNIEKIVLPDTLQSIGAGAFYNCENLEELTIPEGVVSIGERAFCYCDRLTAIRLPGSLRQLGESAFYSCKGLASVSFAGGVEVLSKCAFMECNALRFLEIPEGVSEIGDCAFGSCDVLEEVIIPDTVKSIGDYVFSYCRKLKTVTIPSSVTFIDAYTFEQCDSLNQVIFQGDAPILGENLFHNTATTVFYPGENATWTEAVMQQYGGEITWLPYGATPEIASGWSGATEWTLSIDGVLRICGSGNMKNYDYSGVRPWESYIRNITAVVVEPGVTSIGECAFMGLTNLQSVTLPETGLKKIGEAAFYGCSALKEIQLPEQLYTVNDYTFKNCTRLESVHFPKTLLKIGQGAFENCFALDDLFIPGDTEIIGSWSFKGCAGLTEVDMTWADATEIREGAFKNCSSLTTIRLPANIQTLGDSCFYGIGATSFTVPETVTSIEAWCFARAYSLKNLYFEGDAPTIGEGAFNKITLTARYPRDNATWTAEVMQNYGGAVTWKAK